VVNHLSLSAVARVTFLFKTLIKSMLPPQKFIGGGDDVVRLKDSGELATLTKGI
jgi:hypothetical protein